MKSGDRYLLFAGYTNHYPADRVTNCRGCFATAGLAQLAALEEDFDWAHVVDSETNGAVFSADGEWRDKGDPIEWTAP